MKGKNKENKLKIEKQWKKVYIQNTEEKIFLKVKQALRNIKVSP